MKEIIIKDIDLIQLKYTKFFYRYPNKIVLSISKSIVIFPSKLCEFLKLKEGDEVLFAKNSSGFYISVVTDKYIRGSIVCHQLSKRYVNSLKGSVKSLIALNIQKGVYELEQEEYFDKKSSISWYKLNFVQ